MSLPTWKQSRLSVWIAHLIALMVLSVVASACGGGEPRDPMELVPARANLLASVDMTLILTDADVIEAYELISTTDDTMPATLDELLAKSTEELGLDISGFGSLVLFADIETPEGGLGGILDNESGSTVDDFMGILASTDLDRDDLFDAVKANSPTAVVDGEYEGVKLLSLDDGDTSVALVDGVVAFGGVAAVEAVIDIAEKNASVISGPVLTLYDELGAAWAKLAVELPADLTDSLGDPGELGLPVDFSAALDIEALGVVATKDTTDLVIQLVLRYPTPEGASETQLMLTDLFELFGSFAGDDGTGELLDGLNIASVGNDLTIEFKQDVQETLDDLRQSIEENGGIDPFGIGL